MNRPIVKLSEMNTMDVGLQSTGPQCISKVEIPEEYGRSLLTHIPHIDGLFGELIPGMTIAVGAHPGTGKTTFFLQLSDIFSTQGLDVCFISGEQDVGMIKKTSDRINATGFDVMNETDLHKIEDIIMTGKYDMVVIDSIHSLSVAGVTGTNKTIKVVTNKLHAAAKNSKTIVVMICHSTLKGMIKGGTLVTHVIDCEFYIHKHKDQVRKLFTEKNRMGATGSVYLNMTGTGFDLHNEVNPDTCLTLKDAYIHHMVDYMTDQAAISVEDLYELCDAHDLCVVTAQEILQELVDQDKVIQDDDLWIVNL